MPAPRIFLRVWVIVVGLMAPSVVSAEEPPRGAKTQPSEGLRLRSGPYARFVSRDAVEILWDMMEPAAAVLTYGKKGGELTQKVDLADAKGSHAALIRGLEPRTEYSYRIKVGAGGAERLSRIYPLDTSLNYVVPPVPPPPASLDSDAQAGLYRKAAECILAESRITQGYCLVYGLTSGRLAYELARQSNLIVMGYDEDDSRVQTARAWLSKTGSYGTRVTVRQVASLAKLPIPSCSSNLIVCERLLSESTVPGSGAEVHRVLCPEGGTAFLGSPNRTGNKPSKESLQRLFEGTGIAGKISEGNDGIWVQFVRPALPGRGTWTHQYAEPGNTATGGEMLCGLTRTTDLAVQWLGHPGGDFGIDRNPRMPAPLAIGGRLFHQGLNRMIALNACNGAVLWSLEIPELRRVNMPRDASNWCADSDSVYAAIEDACWRFDAPTGNRRSVYRINADGMNSATHDWGYVAQVGNRLYGSRVKKGSIFTEYWGHVAWYDAADGAGAEKICSDAIFALDKETGKHTWTYSDGAIINTTIVIGDGCMYFVESRHPEIKASKTGRIGSSRLWSDQYLVALDATTGAKRWQQAIDTADGVTVFFMICSGDAIVIMSSRPAKYHLYAFNAADGTPRWQADHSWTGNDHSGHMQHPVVMGGRVYQEPCVYDLKTGQKLSDKMGRHNGCATYAGLSGALLYRGDARRISLWDIQTGSITGWNNLRPSCWLSCIPAGGMVLAPEGGGGCSCGNWFETSVGFLPKKW